MTEDAFYGLVVVNAQFDDEFIKCHRYHVTTHDVIDVIYGCIVKVKNGCP